MTSLTGRVLLVDDDVGFRRSTAALLRTEGHTVDTVADGQAAIEALRSTSYDLMMLDLRMPGVDGLAVIEALRLWGNGIPILMVSGFGTVDAAVRAMHLGADDFLTKPVEPDVLTARVAELLERRPMAEEQLRNPAGIIGRAPAMQQLLATLRKVAPTDTTVMISGETGTGKELVARAVHELSPRRSAPFVAVNCASLSEGLLESELFGHVRGAFTGAVRDRVGLFEAAGNGTIFLDEIGEVSMALQQRLLRVLQEREVTRVGAVKPIPVGARVVAATNRDLKALVVKGVFREDLLYRLMIFPLALPPLRDRPSDIPLLVAHALQQAWPLMRTGREGTRTFGASTIRGELTCSPFAVRLLREFEWPGNVRQLLATVESAAIHAGFGRIEAQHLPDDIRGHRGRRIHEHLAAGISGISDTRYRWPNDTENERTAIEAALAETGGAIGRSAELLGMGRTTLWRKLRTHGLASGSPDESDLQTP